MNALQEATTQAAQSAELTASAIRAAHKASCWPETDAIQILLVEALADAVKLQRRLEAIAACAASAFYAAR